MKPTRNPFARKFAGYKIGRLTIFPWVGFWSAGVSHIGSTRLLRLGYSRVFIDPKSRGDR